MYELLTDAAVQKLRDKGWKETREGGLVVMLHPGLMGKYSVVEAIKMQKMLDAERVPLVRYPDYDSDKK